MMVSFFDLFAMLLLLTAAFGWFNQVFFHLPTNIGLLLMGVAAALVVLIADLLIPDIAMIKDLSAILRKIDFYDAVMHGMLAFLLFAGALHVDWSRLRRRIVPVATMATLGVVISTVVVGFGMWGLGLLLGVKLPLAWALVFGALISPTDPVAVLSLLKQVSVPQLLETEISGEALFNDGVGVVLFTMLLTMATSGNDAISLLDAVGLFLLEAVGGGLIGLITGYVAYRAMRQVDEYVIEVFISLALVMCTYALADKLHTSGPIAVVIAGLVIGTRGPDDAMSETTQRYLFGFWTLIDELLNSVLFLLIGLELIVVGVNLRFGWLALCAIPLVLIARAAAVSIPVTGLSLFHALHQGQRSGDDLGRRARRHLGGVGAVTALRRGALDHPDRHLCGGAVHHHRAGADPHEGDPPHRAVVAQRAGGEELDKLRSFPRKRSLRRNAWPVVQPVIADLCAQRVRIVSSRSMVSSCSSTCLIACSTSGSSTFSSACARRSVRRYSRASRCRLPLRTPMSAAMASSASKAARQAFASGEGSTASGVSRTAGDVSPTASIVSPRNKVRVLSGINGGSGAG